MDISCLVPGSKYSSSYARERLKVASRAKKPARDPLIKHVSVCVHTCRPCKRRVIRDLPLSASARTSPPRRARRWTAPLSPGALPSVMVIIFPNFLPPGGPSYAGSLGRGTHRPARYPPAASNDSTHRSRGHARSTCLSCLIFGVDF